MVEGLQAERPFLLLSGRVDGMIEFSVWGRMEREVPVGFQLLISLGPPLRFIAGVVEEP